MTVPGAVQLIAELAPTLPDGFLLGAGTVTDAETARRVIDAGARFVVSPVFRRDGHRGVPCARRRGRCPAASPPPRSSTPGKPAPTSSRCSRRRRSGPATSRTCAAPLPQVKLMPTGGVTLDNAGDWIRAGAVAVGVGTALLDAKAIAAGRLRAAPRQRRAASSPTSAAAQVEAVMSRVVTFGEIMLRLSPPGFERFLQSPRARRDLRRRRSQRRGEPGAVRPRERVRHAAPGARDRRRGDPRAARRRRAAPTHIVRGGNRIGIYFAEAGASQRASTVIYDRARSAISEMEPGRDRLGRRC